MGLLVAMVIAMVSSWALALVVMAFVPPLVVAGLVQVWLLGRTGSGKPSPSSQVWPLPRSNVMGGCNGEEIISPAAGEPGVCAAHSDCAAVWATGDLHKETRACSSGSLQVG